MYQSLICFIHYASLFGIYVKGLKYFTWILYLRYLFWWLADIENLSIFRVLHKIEKNPTYWSQNLKFLEFSISHLISSKSNLFDNPSMELIWRWISMYLIPMYSNSNANKYALHQCEMKMEIPHWVDSKEQMASPRDTNQCKWIQRTLFYSSHSTHATKWAPRAKV